MYAPHARRALLLRLAAIAITTVLIIVAAYYLLKNVSMGSLDLLKQCGGPGCSNSITASNTIIAPGQVSLLNGYNLTGSNVSSYRWFEKIPGSDTFTAIAGANASNYSFLPGPNATPGNYSFILETIGANSQIVHSTYENVTLYVAPSVQIYPQNVSLDAGQNVTFRIYTTGSYPLNITVYNVTDNAAMMPMHSFKTITGDSNESYQFTAHAQGTTYLKVFALSGSGKSLVSVNTTNVRIVAANDPVISAQAHSQIMDSGGHEDYSMSISGGIGPFSLYIYNASSRLLSGIIANVPAGNYSYALDTYATKPVQQSYEFLAIDIGTSIPYKVYSSPMPLSINPAPELSISPGEGIFDAGQKANITTTIFGGTPPFTGNFMLHISGATVGTCTNTTAQGYVNVTCPVEFNSTLGIYQGVASYTDQVGVGAYNGLPFTVTSTPYLIVSPAGGQFYTGQTVAETVNLVGGVGQLNESRLTLSSSGGISPYGSCILASASAALCEAIMPTQPGNYTLAINYTDAVGGKAGQRIRFDVQQ